MAKLKVKGLSFRYDSEPLFTDVSFNVEEGEFVSILGPSGCGKSTVLNLLAGVLSPESGEMRVDGQKICGMNTHFAYMPQNDLLFPWKTIMQNVCLHGKLHGNERAAQQRAQELFPAFGLAGYENAYPGELSGGMRQRAAFLRTALCEADVLLLDEPFGALDVISRGDMQDWLMSMRAKLGRTCLLVTHDIDEAIYLSDRILVFGGAPAKIRSVVPVYTAERSRDWLYEQDCYFTVDPDYADNPAVAQLLHSVPLDRLMTETDGMSAVNWALGYAVEPERMGQVLEREPRAIAEAKKVRFDEARAAVYNNLRRFVYGA